MRAFFELPTRPAKGREPYTPACVQHIAFKVKDRATLLEYHEQCEKNGVEVLGVTDRSAFHSFLFERNGHRIEQACADADEDTIMRQLDGLKGKRSRSDRR